MNKGEIAKSNFLKGYNCAQSVALAFKDELNMEEKTIALLVSGFGGGMGRMREVCGCVSGMVFVLSYLYGYSEPKDNQKATDVVARYNDIILKSYEELREK